MAGVAITVDDAGLRSALARLRSGMERPRPAMEELGRHFVLSGQQNIAREMSPEGVAWVPLSPRTANRRIGKRGRRGEHPILIVTARLRNSLTYAAADASVEWGTAVKYGRIHQLGGTIDMPAREGRVSLRTIRKGGRVQTRFARKGVKTAVQRAVSIGAHQIRIPARPYLGVSTADRRAVPEIIGEFLERQVRP